MEALRRLLQQAAAAVADVEPDQARPLPGPSDATNEQPIASTSGRPPLLFAHRCAQPPRALHGAPPPARVAQALQALQAAAAAGARPHNHAAGTAPWLLLPSSMSHSLGYPRF